MALAHAVPLRARTASRQPPTGAGVRIETFGYQGYATNPAFDALIAKAVVHSPSPNFSDVVSRAYRALCEFRIEGIHTTIPFHLELLAEEAVWRGDYDVDFLERWHTRSGRMPA